MGTFHSTATLSSEGACGLYGVYASCTVVIFSCPTSALGLGGPFSLLLLGSNPNLNKYLHEFGMSFSLLSCLIRDPSEYCHLVSSPYVLIGAWKSERSERLAFSPLDTPHHRQNLARAVGADGGCPKVTKPGVALASTDTVRVRKRLGEAWERGYLNASRG